MTLLLFASCKTISHVSTIENKDLSPNFINQKINHINSYTSRIDFKINDTLDYNVNDLKILGDKRIITTNDSKKDVVFKNKSIVKVKLNNHLHNNFIKTKAFYYNNDQLVCVKLVEIIPNQLNEPTLSKRTIYIHNNRVIADTNLTNSSTQSDELINVGQDHLKNEYLLVQ